METPFFFGRGGMPHAFFLILELGLGGYADDARQFNKVNKLEWGGGGICR